MVLNCFVLGVGRPMYPLEREMDEDRKRVCEEQLGLPPFDRERELLLRYGFKSYDVSKDQPAELAYYSVVLLPKKVTLCHYDGLPSGKTKTELSLPGSTPPVVAMEI